LPWLAAARLVWGVLDLIDDRDQVESGSPLPRRLAVTVP
jgi:hypothetical protein